MAWFRFEKPFDYSPVARKGLVTIAYQPGVYNVPRECATLATAAGAGKPAKATKSDDEEYDGR
jgi:hypothetical protein